MSTFKAEELDAVFRVTLPPRPYPGLRPFEKEEWPIFFGRERMADAVVAQLISKHLLVVHGDSGCGKSSLVRAGVLPRLEQENARGDIRWRTCTAMPREAPLWNLAEALAGLDGVPPEEGQVIKIRRALNFGQDAPGALAELLRRDPDDHVCILIDQFEELFDHARRHGPDEARLLIEILVGLFATPPAGLYAILTMRSEFLGGCARFRDFAETVNATQYLLPRMEHADLLRAIREPATLYGGTVSGALAERLIADAGGGQDELPLIQHGLMLLHRERMAARLEGSDLSERQNDTLSSGEPAWRLGLEHYRHEGRLAGLLSDHADAVMREAERTYLQPGAPSRVVEDLFRALTDINAEGQAIRRPQTLAQLVAVTGADEASLRGIIDVFRADGVSFLKPYGSEPIGASELIDVSHEALIRCWRKIADPKDGWLVREFNDGLIWRALLIQTESFERDPTNVLAPTTTDEREQWLRRRSPAWAERYGGGWERVQKLLAASAEARDRQRAERAAAERKEQRMRTLLFGLGFVTLLLVASFSGYVAWRESREAQLQFASADAARERSEELMREAQQSAAAVSAVVNELESAVTEAEPSPALAQTLREASGKLTVQVYNLDTVAQPLAVAPVEVRPPLAVTPPVEVRPPDAPGITPRVYIHIAEEAQRAPARAFEFRLEASKLDSLAVVVPGIELVKASPPRSVLRCFRVEECRTDGIRLVNTVNELLRTPQVVLEDQSARYGESTNIRPRHYELWFAPGDDIRLRSE